ncbi:diguanylate cyclase (GGDEF) domain-containing protein [Roseateles sp. YR242]|uniref:tetratricopeptide repeat-containing diguanylate cyclase n=1 Tax=Roseateles sp. YR242 TaxID=1855305 RepID=UPI0008CDBF07|nr:GGDEF domain-containing protein [Roseateles sp. YR242]SEL58345.1 diguanylate cyclase (GGDEF) domain-containing protein [Roseateles sp. YR242]
MSEQAAEVLALLEQANELARLGQGQEAIARVQAAQALLPDDTSPHLTAEAELCQASIELRLLGQFEEALAMARQAALHFQQAREAHGECRALATQAIAASRLGYYETALDCALMAVKLSTRSESPDALKAQVVAYQAVSVAMFSGRNYADAAPASEQAIDIAGRCTPPLDTFELHVDAASTESLRYFVERDTGADPQVLERMSRHLEACDRIQALGLGTRSIGTGGHTNNLLIHALSKTLWLVWRQDEPAATAQLAVFKAMIRLYPRPWLEAASVWAEAELLRLRGDLLAARQRSVDMVDIALRTQHETLTGIGLRLQAQLAELVGDYRAAVAALRSLDRREQEARSRSLRGRLAVVERQFELRQRNLQLDAVEADRSHFARLALEDGLTGLPNRRCAEEEIQRAVAHVTETGADLCVAMVDVNAFKQINDNFSHGVGDLVLKSIGSIIRSCVRERDIPARLGGDEFVLLLRDTRGHQAEQLAERLSQAVSQHDWSSVHPGLQVSISVGVAQAAPGDTMSTVIDRADAGMYASKRQHQTSAR